MAIWDFLTLDEEVEQEEKRVKSTYNPVNVGMFGFSDGQHLFVNDFSSRSMSLLCQHSFDTLFMWQVTLS